MNPTTDSTSLRHPLPDLTDTGQWRLIIYLAKDGMSVWIKSTEDLTSPVRRVFASTWQPDPDHLLHRIENAVYDHPKVLDDFSADIIVETERTLWVPKALAGENPEEECEKWVEQVWPGMSTEYIADDCGDKLCLHLLTSGLRDFLSRTFPGTRIACHQSRLVSNLSGRAADETRLYVDIREREADFLLFSGKSLLNCTTRSWFADLDIVWQIFYLLGVYSLDPAKVQVCLSGLRDIREFIAREIRKYVGFVMLTMVPKTECDSPLPLAAAFCAARNNVNHK